MLAEPVTTAPPAPATRRLGVRAPATVAAALSGYAGAVHLYAAPEHVRAWWGYGAFFVGCGLAQLLFALLVHRRPSPRLVVAGIAGNLAVVGLYVLSRTNGVPVGPIHSGHRLEPAGTLDLAATAAELALVVVLVSLLPRRAGRTAVNVLLGAGLVLWALRLTGQLG